MFSSDASIIYLIFLIFHYFDKLLLNYLWKQENFAFWSEQYGMHLW